MVDSIKEVRVDTRPPRVEHRLGRARTWSCPGGPREVRIRYRGPRNKAPEFRVFRTDDDVPGPVARCSAATRAASGVWDGTVRGGGPAPDGSYSFNVKVRDLAGNKTEAPARRPRRAGRAARGPGWPCARSRSRGPLGVVPAGSLARAPGRARASAGSSSRSRASGSRRDHPPGPPPRRAAARADPQRRAHGRVPGAGAGSPAGGAPCGRWRWRACPPRGTRGRPRPIVVLPGGHLAGHERVRLRPRRLRGHARRGERGARRAPVRRRRLPLALRAREVSPLLRFLDRERLPYDLTTDLVARPAGGPGDRQRAGRGDRRARSTWLPRRVRDRLLEEVKEQGPGGRLVRARVAAPDRGAGRAGPAQPQPAAARRPLRRAHRALHAPTRRRRCARSRTGSGCSRGVDALFGEFSVFERSDRLPAGCRAAHVGGPRGGRAGVRGLPPRQGHGDPARHAAVGAASWRRARWAWRCRA